jgi:hypothetical chaperone protein
MQSIGIDFGTTNTVFAAAEADGPAAALSFLHGGETLDAIRTTLSFRRAGRAEPLREAGPWAIDAFIEAPEDTRFLQSFKSFAASAAFSDTAIFSRRFKFEDLLAAFIREAGRRAGLGAFPKRAVIGRPVTFAGSNPDEATARRRYDAAFAALGFEDVVYVLEPVAAAYFYAQRLTEASTILVGDFGGGTSDFSVVRFEPGGKAEALGHAGVGVAGDSFDYRIIDAVVSPRLGKNAVYRSWGKELSVPVHYFANFARWNELCLMNRPDVIRELAQFAKASASGAELRAFIDLIEGGASYDLYRTVSKAKAELSDRDSTDFNFASPGVSIAAPIARADFESWIAEDLVRIDACVDQVLRKTGLAPGAIDRVFLTGGSSYVPAVRRLFVERFGAGRIETGDQLLSIAKGLALIGASGESAKWSVR